MDVRIIAATNRDLEQAVQDGAFREDLYFRLKVVTLSLPALRERLADIPLLARHFLRLHAQEMDLPNPGITSEGEAELMRYHWPGNVRELSNCLQKAVIFSKGGVLGQREIESALRHPSPKARGTKNDPQEVMAEWARQSLLSNHGKKPYEEAMDEISALLLKTALEMTEGNKTRAATLLGLTRPTPAFQAGQAPIDHRHQGHRYAFLTPAGGYQDAPPFFFTDCKRKLTCDRPPSRVTFREQTIKILLF